MQEYHGIGALISDHRVQWERPEDTPIPPKVELRSERSVLKNFFNIASVKKFPKITVPTSRLFLAHNRLFLVSLQIGKKAQGEGGTGGVQVGARDRSLGP